MLRHEIPAVAERGESKKRESMPDDRIVPTVTFVPEGGGISVPNSEWGYFREEAPEDGYVVEAGGMAIFVPESELKKARNGDSRKTRRVTGEFVPEGIPEREEDTELEAHLSSRVYACGCGDRGYAERTYLASEYAEWERTEDKQGRTAPVDWPDGWVGGRCTRCGTLIEVRVDKKESEDQNGSQQEE